MVNQRKLPSVHELKKLREQGWSYRDIADEYGASEGAVYQQLSGAGLTKTAPSYKHLKPWTVLTQHQHAVPSLMLNLLGRRQNGDTLPPEKVNRLDRWLRRLQAADVVVAYHPQTPPNPASPRTGGWYYAPRRPEDGDSLIRAPEDAAAESVDAEPVKRQRRSRAK